MFGFIVGGVPILIGLFGAFKILTKGKEWFKLIWVEVLIFLVSVLLIGSASFDVNVATTISIFTSLAGMLVIKMGSAPTNLISSSGMIFVSAAGYFLGFAFVVLRFLNNGV